MSKTFFDRRSEANAALNAAGIKKRDFPLFVEETVNGYVCDLDLAARHILNVNSPHNVNRLPGVHRSGDLKTRGAA